MTDEIRVAELVHRGLESAHLSVQLALREYPALLATNSVCFVKNVLLLYSGEERRNLALGPVEEDLGYSWWLQIG